MNHETTIKRIQELVPSVMDWEFGCRYIISGEVCTVNGGNYRLTEDKKGINITSLCNHPKYTKCCNAYQNIDDEPRYYSITEILGKPITLAVVLMALNESKNRSFVYCIEIKKWVETESNNAVRLFYIIATSWNLSKDNFNDQSEETKTFIGGLLGN